jgi:hypothetical protein
MIQDFINGVWSKIPICCIIFFIRSRKTYRNDVAYEISKKRGLMPELVELPNGYYGMACSSDTVEYV